MSLFVLVFYIMFIVFIIKVKKAAQSGGNLEGERKQGGRYSAINQTETKENGLFDSVSSAELKWEEARQPKIRNNNLWGEDKYAKQRSVALRLMEGDPVPSGYVKIKCPYCGAENLVTKNCKKYHSCYFCRVPID